MGKPQFLRKSLRKERRREKDDLPPLSASSVGVRHVVRSVSLDTSSPSSVERDIHRSSSEPLFDKQHEVPALTYSQSVESDDGSSDAPSSTGGGNPSSSLHTSSDVPAIRPPLRPRAGSSTHDIMEILQDISIIHDEKDFQHVPELLQTRTVWRSLPGDKLEVRSLDYKRNRSKIPSPGELYSCIKVDFVESPQRLANMASRVELPETKPHPHKTWHAPDIFVVTLSLPSDPNGGKLDGPSYTICMYFAMKDETRRVLAKLTAPPVDSQDDTTITTPHPNAPAILLFNEWCKRAPTDPSFQARFKLIPSIQNIADLGLPSWIARWNGKPVLIKRTGKTGFLYERENVLEMEVSFHPFPWAAKQAIQYLREHVLHKLLLTFGFVIEAREDHELPETVIGLCQLCFPRSEHAIPVNEFFGSDRVKMRTVYSGAW